MSYYLKSSMEPDAWLRPQVQLKPRLFPSFLGENSLDALNIR